MPDDAPDHSVLIDKCYDNGKSVVPERDSEGHYSNVFAMIIDAKTLLMVSQCIRECSTMLQTDH